MRTAGLLALLICLLAASSPASWAQEAPTTFAAVEAMAEKLASQPYNEPPSIEGDMRGLGYDQYRALRPRPTAPCGVRARACSASNSFRRASSTTSPCRSSSSTAATSRRFRSRPTSSTSPIRAEGAAEGAHAGGLPPAPSAEPAGQVRRGDLLPGRKLFPADRARTDLRRSARGLAIDTAVGRPEEFPTFPHLLAGQARGRGGRDDGVGAARFAQRDRRLLLHHPAGRAHRSSTPRACCSCATTSRCSALRR